MIELENPAWEFKDCLDCSPFAFSVLRVQRDTTGAPSTFEFCYVNAAFAGLSGILPEEVIGRSFSANSKAKISEWSGQFEKAAFDGESSELDFCDPETLQYHNVRCFQITPGYCACIVSDVTAQRQLEQQQSLQTLEYKFVDESLPSGFVIASPYPDFHIEFINKTMLRMLRYDSYDDFIAHVGYSAWSFIHPDDLDRTRQAALHCGDSIDTFEIDYRILRKDGSLLWVNQCSKHAVNAAGKPLVFAYYTDITESKQKDEELRRDAQRYQALVESIPGGVGVYKFSEKPVVTYFNDRVATLCGLTREEYQQIASDDAMAVIYPEDRAGLAHEIEQAIAEKRNIAYTYRLIVKDKGYVWIHLSGCPMEDSEDGYPVYSTVFLDINADKQRELELKTQQQKLQVALKNTDTYIWEFDFKQHCILQEANSQSVHGYSAVIQNVPQSLIESGFVHSDYIPAYRDIFRQLFEGAETASGDFLVRTADQSGWWRERITYTTIFDESGLPYKAIGVGKDITEHTHQLSLLQNRYNSELAYKNALKADNLLATVRANVSCDAIEEFDLPRLDFPDNYTGTRFSDSLLKISKYIVGDAPRAAFLSTFNLETLRSSFSAGEKSFHVEHKRQFLNGDIRWVSTTAKLLLRPDTDELICFLYSYDINEEKVLQEVLHTVVELDYDYVISIDGKTDHYMLFPNQHGVPMSPRTSTSYEEERGVYAEQYITVEDRKRVIAEMSLKNIFAQLEAKPIYAVYAKMLSNGGVVRQKKLRYSYIDEDRKIILLTQRDITDIIEKEELQKSTLRSALAAAEQANTAKSEFLSRMSHEIRTPMNAIIGMSTLAAQCIGDSEQVADCLSKVGISARFLLSLINDILDMSRIESGKVFIKQEKIAFEEFITGINAICYAQAQSSNVEYDAIITSFTEDYYIGDAMKLQQVLINIISNAIKFTSSGGRVQFIVHQDKIKKGEALLRFTINDTGIGINEEFLPHIFEPFEQAHTGITSMYGGTGLGLAICKNLVNLMGGTINVNSIEGVGTEFSVEIKLAVSDESRRREQLSVGIPLENLKALIVDDDVLICHHTEDILRDMGVDAQWVDSGRKAIDRVQECWAHQDFFNIIFVDWKMPDMDGIETTKELRKIVGPDVTIIIMTAYDWISIETEAKRAGVNLLISKPLFKSSLSSTFEKISRDKQTQSLEFSPPRDFDFTGKRVLLVEDHLLNVEVARRLLTAKHFEVVVAENGLQAIELFAKNESHYFDVILMDIRMPVMDGITAAKSIRQMRNADAKSIPIIAMTANAFEEDIEKTRSAGMNAHLSKPIEPELLYRTLWNFLFDAKER